MTKKYDVIVYIGRFQPVHNGHLETFWRAASLAHKVVIVMGSANKPRTYKNPFSVEERKFMLRSAIDLSGLEDKFKTSFHINANIDTPYDDNAWMSRVQSIVAAHSEEGDRVGIIGHLKDDSSSYLNWFPQWDLVEQEMIEPLDATQIRDLFFRESPMLNFVRAVVPESTFTFLENFKFRDEYKQIIREREFLDGHKKMWSAAPYTPTFQTADVVLVQAGHILLIKRRAEPGKGLWALPGGYLNAATDKTILDAAIRELLEETQVKVPEKVLRGSLKDSKVFDALGRSERGRIITQAFFITLSDGEWNLPKVKGADDAEKAVWMPLSSVKSEEMFEDHFSIIQNFIKI